MQPARNPAPDTITRIIEASTHRAAKWLKNSATGEVWYWPSETATHASVADTLGISDYTKGIATPKG